MTSPLPLFETILRQIARAAPDPWYPSSFALSAGIPRQDLDRPLDELRRAGLIHAASRGPGEEPGYVLTFQGIQTLQDPRQLARLLDGRAPVRPPSPQPLAHPDPAVRERAAVVRDALLGPFTPFVTWALLVVNLAVFGVGFYLARQANVSSQFLHPFGPIQGAREIQDIQHRTGSVSPEDIVDGQWWRLMTCCFVHFGLVHLAVNMLSLYSIGPLLERMWGHTRFLILYLIAGLGGSCAGVFTAFHPGNGQPVALAGASGALWGIVASMAAWMFLNRKALPRDLIRQWRGQLIFLLILNVGITLYFDEISKGGHFGGGLVGLVVAVPLHYQRFGRGWRRWVALAGLVPAPMLCLAALARPEKVAALVGADKLAKNWAQLTRQQEASKAVVDYQREVEALDKQATEAYKQHVKFLFDDRHPTRRQPEEIKKAVEVLSQQREKLSQAAKLLADARPHQTKELEEARKAGQEYFRDQAAFFQLAEDYLKQGKGDDGTFQGQRRRAEERRKEWQDGIQKSRQQPREK